MSRIQPEGALLYLHKNIVGIQVTPHWRAEDERFCVHFPALYQKKSAHIIIEADRITLQSDNSVSFALSEDQAQELMAVLSEEHGPVFFYKTSGITLGFSFAHESVEEEEPAVHTLKRIS